MAIEKDKFKRAKAAQVIRVFGKEDLYEHFPGRLTKFVEREEEETGEKFENILIAGDKNILFRVDRNGELFLSDGFTAAQAVLFMADALGRHNRPKDDTPLDYEAKKTRFV